MGNGPKESVDFGDKGVSFFGGFTVHACRIAYCNYDCMGRCDR